VDDWRHGEVLDLTDGADPAQRGVARLVTSIHRGSASACLSDCEKLAGSGGVAHGHALSLWR
jgi:hypothetical protein